MIQINYKSIVSVFGAVLLLAPSCQHKQLDNPDPTPTPPVTKGGITLSADWSAIQDEKPTGMTAFLYGAGDAEYKRSSTNNVNKENFPADAGVYKLLLMNQSPSEYKSVSFDGLGNYKTACILASEEAEGKASWYTKSAAEGERVATSPSVIAIGRAKDVTVAAEKYTEVSVKPSRVVYDVNVSVLIKGINYVRSARAAMTGMASCYWMADNKTGSETITHVINEWNPNIDDKSDPTVGSLDASFTCLGLPDWNYDTKAMTRDDAKWDNHLQLELLLVDNKTKLTFDFYIGDRIDIDENTFTISAEIGSNTGSDPEGGDDPNVPIDVPEVKPEGGGGFQVSVADWGDEEKVDITL